MTYIVHCGRSGFEAAHRFNDLDEASRFYHSELENIGAPIELIEFDEDGNFVRLHKQ